MADICFCVFWNIHVSCAANSFFVFLVDISDCGGHFVFTFFVDISCDRHCFCVFCGPLLRTFMCLVYTTGLTGSTSCVCYG